MLVILVSNLDIFSFPQEMVQSPSAMERLALRWNQIYKPTSSQDMVTWYCAAQQVRTESKPFLEPSGLLESALISSFFPESLVSAERGTNAYQISFQKTDASNLFIKEGLNPKIDFLSFEQLLN